MSVDHNVGKNKKLINDPSTYLDKYAKNNPIRNLQNQIKESKERIVKLKQEMDDADGNDEERGAILSRINKDLRDELKKMSDTSSILCDEL